MWVRAFILACQPQCTYPFIASTMCSAPACLFSFQNPTAKQNAKPEISKNTFFSSVLFYLFEIRYSRDGVFLFVVYANARRARIRSKCGMANQLLRAGERTKNCSPSRIRWTSIIFVEQKHITSLRHFNVHASHELGLKFDYFNIEHQYGDGWHVEVSEQGKNSKGNNSNHARHGQHKCIISYSKQSRRIATATSAIKATVNKRSNQKCIIMASTYIWFLRFKPPSLKNAECHVAHVPCPRCVWANAWVVRLVYWMRLPYH